MGGKGTGIHWILGKSVKDLAYADDLALRQEESLCFEKVLV